MTWHASSSTSEKLEWKCQDGNFTLIWTKWHLISEKRQNLFRVSLLKSHRTSIKSTWNTSEIRQTLKKSRKVYIHEDRVEGPMFWSHNNKRTITIRGGRGDLSIFKSSRSENFNLRIVTNRCVRYVVSGVILVSGSQIKRRILKHTRFQVGNQCNYLSTAWLISKTNTRRINLKD